LDGGETRVQVESSDAIRNEPESVIAKTATPSPLPGVGMSARFRTAAGGCCGMRAQVEPLSVDRYTLVPAAANACPETVAIAAMLVSGSPVTAGDHVVPLSVDRKIPRSAVPARNTESTAMTDVAMSEVNPLLAGSQWAPTSVETNIPADMPAAMRMPFEGDPAPRENARAATVG
jgi:hypothetical protein